MRFSCSTCGEIHDGLPDIGFDAPVYYAGIPEGERGSLARLGTDLCAIDDTDFFIRGVLEIPIKGTGEVFAWGVWVTLSRAHFDRYVELFEADPLPGEGSWFGWFSNRLPGYPDTLNLKTRVHLQSGRQRPRIELEPSDHPLAVQQRDGVALSELVKILGAHLHGGTGQDDKV